jgi:hypothetical protein
VIWQVLFLVACAAFGLHLITLVIFPNPVSLLFMMITGWYIGWVIHKIYPTMEKYDEGS